MALGDAIALMVPLVVLGLSAPGAAYTALVAIVLLAGDGYRIPWTVTALATLPALAMRAAAPLVLVLPYAAQPRALTRLTTITILSLLLLRVVSYAVVCTLRTHGALRRDALIVGAGTVALDLAQTLTEHREYGLHPVGFVDSCGIVDNCADVEPPALGPIEQLDSALEVTDATVLLVAFGSSRDAELVDMLRIANERAADVYVVPRFFELGLGRPSSIQDHVRGIPLQWVRPAASRMLSWRAKRVFDCAVAGVAFALLSPLILVAALLVKWTSPGPVLFRQRRTGQHGRRFDILKFRSMLVHEGSDTEWSSSQNDLYSPVGKFLRRTSMDELPQLLNVIRGDMSLVGPRPERPHFVREFTRAIPGYSTRHRLPVGLTGLAQVQGLRGNTSIAVRTRFDNFYIENWSLWRDVVILVRTVLTVVRCKGS